jgi:1,4-dihydroxy-2-naphthoate octaprenyltransferase
MSSNPAIAPGSFAAWRVALRPRTLPIAMIPVVVATSLAWALTGAFDPGIAAIALAASMLMQVVTNLQNDVGFTERGGETGGRVGLPRATANGWLTPAAVRRGIVVAIVVAQLVALPLMIRGGWPIVLTSVSSTAAAWGYMGGPRPIAYTPLGELTVFLFFGLVAVCGAFYVQAGTIGGAAFVAGTAIGLLAAAVLLVNNMRDRAHDAATGRRTLAVELGESGTRAVYRLLVLVPFALAALLAWLAGPWFLLPLAALPWGLRLVATFDDTPAGPAFTALMFSTVKLEVAFGAALSLAALLHGAG